MDITCPNKHPFPMPVQMHCHAHDGQYTCPTGNDDVAQPVFSSSSSLDKLHIHAVAFSRREGGT